MASPIVTLLKHAVLCVACAVAASAGAAPDAASPASEKSDSAPLPATDPVSAAGRDSAAPAAAPDAAASLGAKPGGVISGSTGPESAADSTKPEAAASDSAQPDAATTGSTKPEAAASDSAKPGTATSDSAKPDAASFDAAAPDVPAPAAPDAAAAEPAPPAPGNDVIARAAEAFQLRNSADLAAAAAQAHGNILESYVQYWQLQLAMDDTTAQAVHAFMQRYAGTVLAERLKDDWIRELGKREQWGDLAAEHPVVKSGDAEMACLIGRGRLYAGDETAALQARTAWDQPKAIPDTCLPLVERMIERRTITASDIWLRVRRLLQSNDIEAARQTYAYLPANEQPSSRALAKAAAKPQRYLSQRKLAIGTRAERETVIFALERLAREDPSEAGATFDRRMQSKFSPADRGYVFGRIGLHAARFHRPEALAWFELAAPTPLTEDQLAWRARAALRDERWRELKRSIEEMPGSMRREEGWIYWYGRTLQGLGELGAAREQFSAIADRLDFYGRLAAEELGLPLEIPPRVYSPSPEDVDEVSRDPSLQRAIALFRLDLRPEGLREWNWGVRNYDDRHLLAAGELARRAEIWDRAINAADRTQEIHDFGLQFIAPYFETFMQQARRQGLDDAWVLGVARQESRFTANIRSSAGAIGVMQLMPQTARLVAKHIGLAGLKTSDVVDVETNVLLGTSYLREMLDRLDGQPLLASAAYNAGPLRAERWRGDRPLEGAIYAETIPYNETRDYVKKVLFNAACYAAILGRDPVQLKTLMSVVAPRAPTIADNLH